LWIASHFVLAMTEWVFVLAMTVLVGGFSGLLRHGVAIPRNDGGVGSS
jgi:hypothetical protein